MFVAKGHHSHRQLLQVPPIRQVVVSRAPALLRLLLELELEHARVVLHRLVGGGVHRVETLEVRLVCLAVFLVQRKRAARVAR